LPGGGRYLENTMPIKTLSEMADGEQADLFVMMSSKEELVTKTGKPYFKVAFRDAGREVSFPIWGDSPWAVDCRDHWAPGTFYKLRAVYRETSYGPQLEIQKIRETTDADADDGFDPAGLRPQSRFDTAEMFDALLAIVREKIGDGPLCELVEAILTGNREAIMSCPAARHHHHAFAGGLLEHTLSVTRSCVFLAEKYAEYYDGMAPPLDVGLVVAGAALHDVGKIRELQQQPEGTAYTAEGSMIGHLLMGRDMAREAAAAGDIDAETLLRLEHLIISHQRLPEWGSPTPPMTPEALIVHYADDLDAKFHMMATILREDKGPGPMTSRRNVLGHQVFRGLSE